MVFAPSTAIVIILCFTCVFAGLLAVLERSEHGHRRAFPLPLQPLFCSVLGALAELLLICIKTILPVAPLRRRQISLLR